MVEVRLKLVVQVCLVEGISSRFRSGFWLWEKWSFLDFVEDCGFLIRALLVEQAVELEMD